MKMELTYVEPYFTGKADLIAMEDSLRRNSKVVFKYSIDETREPPETIHISITRERWEKLGKPTELSIRVTKISTDE